MTNNLKSQSRPALAHKIPTALKYGVYSKTAVLPGESQAAFDTLHRTLIAEFAPKGALEDDTVETMARLIWRKQNLQTLQSAKLAQKRLSSILDEMIAARFPDQAAIKSHPESEKIIEAAKNQVRAELGDACDLIELGANDLAVRRALELAGIEFIDENGGGPGVRLHKHHRPKQPK